MTYDDRFIYVCRDVATRDPGNMSPPPLRRDFFGGFIDAFNVIDTYKDKTNAFQFGVTPMVFNAKD